MNLKRITQEEFHALDYQVMKEVFAVHKELGRFCEEAIYESELSHRCRQMGFSDVKTEVPVQVTHGDFLKTYYIDLLVAGSGIYELKTAVALVPEHRTQALQYLLLTGLNHGRLVNLRTPSVQYQFVSTRLTQEKRRQFTVVEDEWRALNERGSWLRNLVLELLTDGGAFLEVELFCEAIVHFGGGEGAMVRRIPLRQDSRTLGTQRAHVLDDRIAFKLSAVTIAPASYEQHLRRFLAHTDLEAIQWINFNHHDIVFTTLTR